MGVPTRTPGAIHTSERADGAARRLRREPTGAEALLWKTLKHWRDQGVHFRRQVPMGPYIADFACHRSRLIVEVDGGVHRDKETAARDRERDVWLGSRDYRVLRVSNDEVFANMASVIERIEAFVRVDTPTPTPPRKGEGLYVGEE